MAKLKAMQVFVSVVDNMVLCDAPGTNTLQRE